MNFSRIAKQGEKFVTDNSPALLTAVGITGSLAAAYLTGKASFRAAKILEDEQYQINIKRSAGEKRHDLEPKEKIKLVWKLYVPPIVMISLSTAAVIGANRVGTRRAAAMATAYGLSERAYSEYKEKVIEKIGENKERAVRDEIAQDRVRKQPPKSSEVIMGTGDQLCYEALTGRYFMSSMEEIKKAENHINSQILKHGYASLSEFYDWLGLNHTSISDDVGWGSALELMECRFSSTIAEDDRPCLVVNFNMEPVRDYDLVH